MKILCTTSSFKAKAFPDNYEVIYNPYKRRLTEEEVLDLIIKHQPDGMIAGVEPLTRKVLQKAKNLKVISRCGVGLDSVDLTAAKEMKIKICNTPEVTVKPVAELTVGMIYSLIRGIGALDMNMKNCKWEKQTGGLIAEKTIGIIGCGRIGTRVAELLLPTGTKIIGYDPALKVHPLIEIVSFEEIITKSDLISLHVPLNHDNRNMINEGVIKSLKKGAIIVNNSRGGLVDENALYKYLSNNHLGGAGMDVYSDEPYNGPLCSLKNVILTPHIGSTAGNSRHEMETESITNLVDAFQKLKMTHIH